MVSCDIISTTSPAEKLPYVVCWPREMSHAFLTTVWNKYTAVSSAVNRFQYSIHIHKADTPRDAVDTLSREGAFATKAGRSALLDVVGEARNTEWCKQEVLDTLERYATYAFVLDGTTMTCGALPDGV